MWIFVLWATGFPEIAAEAWSGSGSSSLLCLILCGEGAWIFSLMSFRVMSPWMLYGLISTKGRDTDGLAFFAPIINFASCTFQRSRSRACRIVVDYDRRRAQAKTSAVSSVAAAGLFLISSAGKPGSISCDQLTSHSSGSSSVPSEFSKQLVPEKSIS